MGAQPLPRKLELAASEAAMSPPLTIQAHHPGTPADAPPRHSYEMRLLCLLKP